MTIIRPISNIELDGEIIRTESQREQPQPTTDGAQLLFDVAAFLGRFIAYPAEEAQYAHQLHGLPESPWGNIRGRPLDDRGLAQRLRRYEIRPKVLKSVNQRGYRREDFEDAWLRYLAPLSCQGA